MINLILWPWAVLLMDRTAFWIVQAIMALVILVAPISFALTVIERDRGLSVGSIAQIVAGVCIGIGLMVNNTAGQIQGFLSSGGEFVRTPKDHHAGSDEVAAAAEAPTVSPKRYRSPLHWTFYIELLVITYCLASTAMLVQAGEALWAVPLVFWAGCLAMVVQLQLTPRHA